MDDFFSLAYRAEPFLLFSPSHQMALALIALVTLLIFLFRRPLRQPAANRWVRWSLAVILFGQEILLQALRLIHDTWYLQGSLPLHLCGISALLAGLLAATRSYKIYQIAYYWGIAGASQALLTPDLGYYSYPHIIFLVFFLSHGAILWSVFFMTWVEGYRPTYPSLWKAFAALNLLALAVGAFNYAFDANYMYLAHKPAGASLLDFLGPWPWYILSLEAMALLIFHLLHLPFAFRASARNPLLERDVIDRIPMDR